MRARPGRAGECCRERPGIVKVTGFFGVEAPETGGIIRYHCALPSFGSAFVTLVHIGAKPRAAELCGSPCGPPDPRIAALATSPGHQPAVRCRRQARDTDRFLRLDSPRQQLNCNCGAVPPNFRAWSNQRYPYRSFPPPGEMALVGGPGPDSTPPVAGWQRRRPHRTTGGLNTTRRYEYRGWPRSGAGHFAYSRTTRKQDS